MRRTSIVAVLFASTALISGRDACAGQAPFGVTAPEIRVSHMDRVYSAEPPCCMDQPGGRSDRGASRSYAMRT